jgi:ribosome-associated protein
MLANSSNLHLPAGVTIPASDLRFEFSRSGGPGGQNVNKVNTRVTLRFDLAGSTSISPVQKAAIRRALGGRINQDGMLRVVSSRHRTQAANRLAAIRRFMELMGGALTPRTPRKKTRIPAAARARRLELKRRAGHQKRLRGRTASSE